MEPRISVMAIHTSHDRTDMLRIAIFDDYQTVALEVADWSPVTEKARVTVFDDHLSDRNEIVGRVVGSVAILTAASRIVSSRNGKESQTHVRLVAVYGQEGGAIRLVHFQSTLIVEKEAV